MDTKQDEKRKAWPLLGQWSVFHGELSRGVSHEASAGRIILGRDVKEQRDLRAQLVEEWVQRGSTHPKAHFRKEH